MLSPPRLSALALALALLRSSPPAWAQPSEAPFRLSWDAQPGCPSEAELQGEIARLTPSATPAARRSLAARGVAYQTQTGRWAGQFRIEQPEFVGEREVEAETCAEVAQAFALSVALALEPNAAPLSPWPSTPSPLPPLPGPEPPAPSAERPANVAPAAKPTGPPDLMGVVGVGPRLHAGLLPGLAFGFGFDAGARWKQLRFYANGIFLPERTSSLEGLSDARGSYGLVAGGLTGCFSWPLGGPEADVCGRTRWGSVWARSEGVTQESTGRGLYGSAGVASALRVPLGQTVALRGELEGGASLRRPSFFIEGTAAGYRPSAFYGGASLGAEASFLPPLFTAGRRSGPRRRFYHRLSRRRP